MDKNRVQDVVSLWLRLFLGVFITFHGAQKMFGVFGGAGVTGTLTMMKNAFGIPAWAAIVAIIAEFFGGLGVLSGLFTRVAALGVASTMAVAVYENAVKTSELTTETVGKIGYPAMLFAMAVAVLVLGGGGASLDRAVFGKRRKR